VWTLPLTKPSGFFACHIIVNICAKLFESCQLMTKLRPGRTDGLSNILVLCDYFNILKSPVTPHFGVKRTLGLKSRNWPQRALLYYISTHFGFQKSKGVIWVLLLILSTDLFSICDIEIFEFKMAVTTLWCLSDKSFIIFTSWNI
jgi:hypothetical protein